MRILNEMLQMNRSLSQRLKRCGQYGTSSGTPKRPCITASLSAQATSTDSDPVLSEDLSSENAEETKTASSDSFPATPCGSDQMTVSAAAASVADCSSASTPRNTGVHVPSSTSTESPATHLLEELRQRRSKLRNSIASKEQTLHNLNLVKLHREKVCCVIFLAF